jgi:hypothetical protein
MLSTGRTAALSRGRLRPVPPDLNPRRAPPRSPLASLGSAVASGLTSGTPDRPGRALRAPRGARRTTSLERPPASPPRTRTGAPAASASRAGSAATRGLLRSRERSRERGTLDAPRGPPGVRVDSENRCGIREVSQVALRGHQGTSMGAMTVTPGRRRRDEKRRRAEERRWAAMAGPVEVRRVDPGNCRTSQAS